jgi:hypothetical protein
LGLPLPPKSQQAYAHNPWAPIHTTLVRNRTLTFIEREDDTKS